MKNFIIVVLFSYLSFPEHFHLILTLVGYISFGNLRVRT